MQQKKYTKNKKYKSLLKHLSFEGGLGTRDSRSSLADSPSITSWPFHIGQPTVSSFPIFMANICRL